MCILCLFGLWVFQQVFWFLCVLEDDMPIGLSKTPSRLAGVLKVVKTRKSAISGHKKVRSSKKTNTHVLVDGHLRLRTPYPVRSAKLSSLKLG